MIEHIVSGLIPLFLLIGWGLGCWTIILLEFWDARRR